MQPAPRPRFQHYIGIDYSGAATPRSSLAGLRIYRADRDTPPVEVLPPPSPRRYWTRRGVADWLIARLSADGPTLVGIDHGFSCPLDYFETHGLPLDWPAFLLDFQRHWPTDGDHVTVDVVRDGSVGAGAARSGQARWRRLTERRAGGAKSVFHFDVPGSVAKSTHAGLPWLLQMRRGLGARLHVWPFDGWSIPAGRSVVAEVYPSLWRDRFQVAGLTADQQDAHAVAAWLRESDRDGSLDAALAPDLTPSERALAEIEGWILGVP